MYYYDLNKVSLNRGRSYINFHITYNKQKVCYICKKRFSTDDDKKIL